MSATPLVLVRDLTGPMAFPRWPEGFARLPFTAQSAPAAHAMLADAYSNGFGEVGGFADWYGDLVTDEEYDPELCFLYGSGDKPACFTQIWTSGFIKDIAVSHAFRRRGIGRALMLTVFAELRHRGLDEVRLKVVPGNDSAIALYRACGMVEG